MQVSWRQLELSLEHTFFGEHLTYNNGPHVFVDCPMTEWTFIFPKMFLSQSFMKNDWWKFFIRGLEEVGLTCRSGA